MANIKPIRSETDYDAALARIYELMDTEPGSPDGDELDVLVDLVELYERKHVRMGYPSPVAAIEFRMDQAGTCSRRPCPVYRKPRQGLGSSLGQACDHYADGARTARASRNSGGGAVEEARS